MKILAIEDNPADVEILRELLADQQGSLFEIKNVRTLAAAKSLVPGGGTDFILLDLGLPDSQGIDTLRAVRALSLAIPIVVLTGFDDEETGVKALHEGAQDYLVKGQITGPSLSRSIRYASERFRIEQELIRKNEDLAAMNEEITAISEELKQNNDELLLNEENLRRSEERYHALFNTLTEGFCVIEVLFDANDRPIDYRFLEINPAFEKQTGLHDAQGKLMRDLAPEHETYWFDIYGKIALTGEPVRFENEAKELHRWYEVFAYKVGGDESRKVAILFNDISERKRMDEALTKNEQRLKRSQEIAHLGSWELDLTGNQLTWSDEVYRIFGLEPQEFGATYEAFLESVHPDDRAMVDAAYRGSIRKGKDNYEVEHRVIQKKGGEILFVHEKCEHFRDITGKIIRSVGMVHDITERKRVEEELRHRNEDLNAANEEIMATQEELQQTVGELSKRERDLNEALDEKDVLLSEIHHRVKNNLTAFISLLSLESAYDSSPAGLALKKDLQNRARSMALIHETLYRTKNYSRVNMDVYLSTLAGQIADSYERAKSVKTVVDAPGITLDLSRATPAGLIINELMTNSLKYAFPASFDCEKVRGTPCTIEVQLIRDDGAYILTVRDNGIGLPGDLDIGTTKTLGLKLVNFLAKHQLRSSIEVHSDKGAEFRFRFRDKK
jgi:PAS domain S-box-containing protein